LFGRKLTGSDVITNISLVIFRDNNAIPTVDCQISLDSALRVFPDGDPLQAAGTGARKFDREIALVRPIWPPD
jgi:hypothetical protein